MLSPELNIIVMLAVEIQRLTGQIESQDDHRKMGGLSVEECERRAKLVGEIETLRTQIAEQLAMQATSRDQLEKTSALNDSQLETIREWQRFCQSCAKMLDCDSTATAVAKALRKRLIRGAK